LAVALGVEGMATATRLAVAAVEDLDEGANGAGGERPGLLHRLKLGYGSEPVAGRPPRLARSVANRPAEQKEWR